MPKVTRLEFIQKALSAIDSENVMTIGDTIESEQIADLLDTTYDDLIGEFNWPFLFTSGKLESTPESNVLKVPEGIYSIEWIKYDKELIDFIPYSEMIDRIDRDGIKTDTAPSYWATRDDENIVFDSYNGVLLPALSLIYGVRVPQRLISDTSVPDIPERFHTVLLHGLVAQCFYTLKGDDSLGDRYYKRFREGKVAMKRWAKLHEEKHLTNKDLNYGRKQRSFAQWFPR